MEVVECGGALAKNAQNGGESFASIMLSKENSKPQIRKAADVLGVTVNFTDFEMGNVDVSSEAKEKIIKVVREVRPDIIITQDPEHSFHDLDPDRRQAMITILEGIALAGRPYALDKLPGLDPHPIPTIYYMTPHQPNTVVDVSDVWNLKNEAMSVLESQMEFSGQHFEEALSDSNLENLVPGFSKLPNNYEKGRAVHKALDHAVHVYHGLATHGHYAFAELFAVKGISI
ncbi:PIG-L deacetylase family protein [Piscibacillus salipiscarius]|uniref:PIG-L deacetylase family protein n=1 Tax=Piscibacillus salipiscarius TaxID=299480 RepID=UPI000AA93CF8|nr:GlcNAc-PI de-N-acetylase [Piscibacillus salipiscarius]